MGSETHNPRTVGDSGEHVSVTESNDTCSWTDRHYRAVMLGLMLLELAMLGWIAWRS